MSIEKFKPIIWAKTINVGLERDSVFYEDCNHEYEGLAKKPGDSIKILGLGKPSTRHFDDGKLHELETPETIEDLSMTLPINQVVDFNFFVDDLDKRQAEGKVLEMYTEEAKDEILQHQDLYIASFALNKQANVLDKAGATATTDNILQMIDAAYTKLLKNDVKPSTEVVLTLDYDHLELLRRAYEKLDTNNSAMMRNGRMGMYHNIIIKASNNVPKDDKGFSCMQLKTRRAISFVKPHMHMEAYKPEKYFGDAVKGYSLFDGAITRPKEMVVIKSKI